MKLVEPIFDLELSLRKEEVLGFSLSLHLHNEIFANLSLHLIYRYSEQPSVRLGHYF